MNLAGMEPRNAIQGEGRIENSKDDRGGLRPPLTILSIVSVALALDFIIGLS